MQDGLTIFFISAELYVDIILCRLKKLNNVHPLNTSKCIICKKLSHIKFIPLVTYYCIDAAVRACNVEMIYQLEEENL